ncbi:hypothetical protein BJV78DRAFT_1175580 [Lactifluus subvellereus]|nr:hypothetical protein BJV78DRAFT_1175580 [Lactifluus subvellereus]
MTNCRGCALKRYTPSPSPARRIVRNESRRSGTCGLGLSPSAHVPEPSPNNFNCKRENPDVAGFKSAVGYRTGLDVSIALGTTTETEALASERFGLGTKVTPRLADKPLTRNDLVVVVRTAVERESKPGMILLCFIFVLRYATLCPFLSHVHRPSQCSSIWVLRTEMSR